MVELAGQQLSVQYVGNSNLMIFSDTIDSTNVKLCMIVDCANQIMNISLFLTFTCIQGR